MNTRLEMMPLTRLLSMQNRKNPKKHDLDEIVASIKRNGFKAPPMVDSATNMMVAGHGRCLALERMRFEGEELPDGIEMGDRAEWMVPALFSAFKSETDRDAYVIADNRLTELGGYDNQLLADMLSQIAESDYGLDGTGFSGEELDALISEYSDEPDEDSPGQDVDVAGHVRTIGAHKARPPIQMTNADWKLELCDCLEGLRRLEDNSVDAVVTDPPAGISFMGREWDSDKGGRDKWIEWLKTVMAECLRVLKPGGHAIVWALPRTSHWTAMALELAGFQVRDRVSWLYVTGFPKSLNVSKAIDSHLGAERQVVGHREDGRGDSHAGVPGSYGFKGAFDVTAPGSPQAEEWAGWGTALKPACEDWWLVRKPLEGTVAENILKWGVGAINIEDTRIGREGGTRALPGSHTGSDTNTVYGSHMGGAPADPNAVLGRWPSHLIVSEGVEIDGIELPAIYFYVPKPSKAETEAGLGALPVHTGADVAGRGEDSAGMNSPRAGVAKGERANIHPTKKPIALMRYLIRLVCPRGGLVCDAFAGSGTTGLAALVEGCRFVGFEMNPDYHLIASERLRSIIEDPRQADAIEAEEAAPQDPVTRAEEEADPES